MFRQAALLLAAVWLAPALWAEEPMPWAYPFQPNLTLEYDIAGTYRATGISTSRIVPKGDSGGSGSISAPGGEGFSAGNGPPPIGTHDGGGSSSFRITLVVEEVEESSGKARCSVQFTKMTGRFDAPGMAGRTMPLCLFPALQGRPFTAIFAPDGGQPDLPDFEGLVREVIGQEIPQAHLDMIVRETERALAACCPALPESGSKPGASYRVGPVTFTVGPQKIFDGKKSVLIAGDGPPFDRERTEGKLTTKEKGGSWQRFWFAKVTRFSLRFEEKQWRNWSQKARTALGNRTDSTETLTYSATLVRADLPKPVPGAQETGPGGEQK